MLRRVIFLGSAVLSLILLVTACVFITGIPQNSFPSIPRSPNPPDKSSEVSLTPVLTWECFDPDGDDLRYDVYFGEQENPPLVAQNLRVREFKPGFLKPNMVYYWRILAKDEFNFISWSPVWSFTTIVNSPPTLTYIEPTNGEVGLPAKGVILKWEAQDPDGDPVSFDVYFGTQSDPPLVLKDTTKTQFVIDELDPGEIYYWKIVAEDSNGLKAVGPVWTFSTLKNLPPVLTYYEPEDGAIVNVEGVKLRWTAADPNGDDVTYDVFFGKQPDPPLVSKDTTQNSYDLPKLEFDTTYYWKIVAKDTKGLSTEGPVWSFKTPANSPPTLAYIEPGNGEVGLPAKGVILKWEAQDPDGDPVSFDVYFGTQSDPPLILKDTSETFFDVGTLQYGKTYYWKIVAKDSRGAERTGPIWSFKTSQNEPPTLKYLYPGNESYGVDVNVTLEWDGEDPEGEKILYDVYFGDSPENLKLVSEKQDSESYRPGKLQNEKEYYWKIVAWDEYGNKTEGPVWKFKTSMNLAPYLEYISPANGSTDMELTVELHWRGGDPEGETVRYDVYVGKEGRSLELVNSNQRETSYTLTDLDYGSVYRWKIVAKDESGNENEGPIWSFRTKYPPVVLTLDASVSTTEGVATSYRLSLIDTHDPENPTLMNYVDLGAERLQDFMAYLVGIFPVWAHISNKIAVHRDGVHVYVPLLGDGFGIVDISDPESPTLVKVISTPGYAMSLSIWDDYLYVAYFKFETDTMSFDTGILAYNISDPVNPVEISNFAQNFVSNNVLMNVLAEGDYVYTSGFDADTGDGYLGIFDVSDPHHPALMGATNLFANSMNVVDDYLYTTVFVQTEDDEIPYFPRFFVILDISDKSNPHVVDLVNNPEENESIILDLYTSDYTYASYFRINESEELYKEGFIVYDISDPSSPASVGEYSTDILEDIEYYYDSHSVYELLERLYFSYHLGLGVFDVSDPTNPTQLGFLDMDKLILDITSP